jgi:hypothetical protein
MNGIKLGAARRSCVVGILKQMLSTEPVTVRYICNHPMMVAANTGALDLNTGDVLVRAMVKEGTLVKVHIYRKEEPHAQFAYSLKDPSSSLHVPPPSLSTAKIKVEPNIASPDVKLDFIKATGRLRVTFKGIAIDIGTAEK